MAEAAPVNITVDGKAVQAPAGTLLIEACKTVGIEVPSFCYYPNLSLAGRLPHVPGESREDAQVADRLHHGHRRRHDRYHRQPGDPSGAQGHGRVAAGKSSAGLPGVRCRRRVRTAGHDVLLRGRRIEIHRTQEPPRRAAVVAGRVLRPAALHPVLPLRARLRRVHGRMGAWACKIAASAPSLRPTKATTLTAKSAACVLTSAPWAR